MKRYIAIAHLTIICVTSHISHSMMRNIHLTPAHTPEIHKAVKVNNLKKLRELIYNAYDVNTPDGLKNTPLHVAAINGLIPVIDILMDNKANIEARNAFHATPLMLAVQHNNKDVVQRLIFHNANCDPPQINKPLWKPLHIVKNIPTLRALLNRCKNIHPRNNFNRTPLLLFCHSGNTKAVILNIQYGADIYASDGSQTPFSIVHNRNHLEIARILNTLHNIRISGQLHHAITPQTDQYTRITLANMLLGQKLYLAANTIIHDTNTGIYARGKILLHAHTLQAHDVNQDDYTALQTCIDAIINRNDAHSIIYTMLTAAYVRTKYGILSSDILKNILSYHRKAIGAYRTPITGNTFAHALAQSPCHRNNVPGLIPAIINANSHIYHPLHNNAQHTPASIAIHNNKLQFSSDYNFELQTYTMHTQQKYGTLTDLAIR